MSRRIKLKLGVLIGFSTVFLILVYRFNVEINTKNEISRNTRILPEISFETVDGEIILLHDLTSVHKTLIIYFNSECEYCIEEAQQIGSRIKELSQYQLVFISSEDSSKIDKFRREFNLLNAENIHFVEDKNALFVETFDPSVIPFLLLYNENKQLIKTFKGATKIDKILKY